MARRPPEETLAQAQEMGLSVYLQLNEGGSAVLSVLGTNMDGSWTAKDATTVELTFDGSSAEATLEGEELVMQQDGDVMRFKRGEIPPAASEVQRDENQAAEPRGLDDPAETSVNNDHRKVLRQLRRAFLCT